MPEQYVINAFDRGPFSGNPAAVVPLEAWPADSVLQQIAAQNNLSETAYFVDQGDAISLRWFTPTQEIELCGHATLATAHAMFAEMDDARDVLRFETLSGELVVTRAGGQYRMNFPEVVPGKGLLTPDVAEASLAALGLEDGEVLLAGPYPFVVLKSAAPIREYEPNFGAIDALPGGHLLVSAPGEDGFDVTTRVFAPGVGIPEDPATGSAHCAFAPYWCSRLGKDVVTARQASARGGYFTCEWRREDGRVDLIGSCSTFSRGSIEL
jgi:PhzF family phenazine biosynthesis protein